MSRRYMIIVTWLRIVAIGLPLIGALILWRWKEKFLYAQRRVVAIIFGLIGLVALTLFVVNKHYACIFLSGRQNCLFDGLATVSLILLSLVLARACVVPRGINNGDYILMLLLSSAWAGMGLSENLFVLLIFLNLFFYVIHRGLTRQGLRWRILSLRDDYKDDSK